MCKLKKNEIGNTYQNVVNCVKLSSAAISWLITRRKQRASSGIGNKGILIVMPSIECISHEHRVCPSHDKANRTITRQRLPYSLFLGTSK